MISRAIRRITSGSMPNSASPASASPLSLSRQRETGFAIAALVLALVVRILAFDLRSNLGSEVGLGLLDAFADFETHEPTDARVLLLQQLPDLHVRVFDERLIDQAHFGEE